MAALVVKKKPGTSSGRMDLDFLSLTITTTHEIDGVTYYCISLRGTLNELLELASVPSLGVAVKYGEIHAGSGTIPHIVCSFSHRFSRFRQLHEEVQRYMVAPLHMVRFHAASLASHWLPFPFCNPPASPFSSCISASQLALFSAPCFFSSHCDCASSL
jgi:hypothetical protein